MKTFILASLLALTAVSGIVAASQSASACTRGTGTPTDCRMGWIPPSRN